MAHAASLVAHGSLAAAGGTRLLTAADPAELSVGTLADRIWRSATGGSEPEVHIAGVRPGETMNEVLVGPGEELGAVLQQGVVGILGDAPTDAAAAVVEEVERCASAEERRRAWLRALAPAAATVS
jgi:FlaA1/EpsC-like NDP-sugar epimerase